MVDYVSLNLKSTSKVLIHEYRILSNYSVTLIQAPLEIMSF